MSFSEIDKIDVLLKRFCTLQNTQVLGAFSKLLVNTLRLNTHIQEIVSFSDNDYSDGGIYRSNNFELVNELKEDYFYVYNSTGVRYHKFTMRKQKLKKRFNLAQEYIESHTEREITRELKLMRCYNSGKKKWVLTL